MFATSLKRPLQIANVDSVIADTIADRLKTELSQMASSLPQYPNDLIDAEIEKHVAVMR